MTEDAGLRARIEAQVAARRAGGAPPRGARRSTGDRPVRRRHDDVEDDEAYEAFTLPEPDASFERPWQRATDPSPTAEGSGLGTGTRAPEVLTASDPPGRPTPGARPAPGSGAGRHPTRPRHSRGISGSTGPVGAAAASREPDGAKPDHRAHGDSKHSRPQVTGRARRLLIRTFVLALIAAIATVLLRTFVVQPYYIPSASMEPTLHGCAGCNDDHVLVDKLSYRAHDIREGDIVVFHRPPNARDIPDKVLIKRVIGRPGDVVEVKNGRVYVNGLVLKEPYVNKDCGADATIPLNGTSKWKVPANDVFVMGDNRCHSDDSRVFGPIATSSVIGRAFAIIWPIGRAGLL